MQEKAYDGGSETHDNKAERREIGTKAESGRENLYFTLGPCVVHYLPLFCFCPTSSAHTRRANNTPAKLIGNTHTYKHTRASASILAPSWREYSTLLLIPSELPPEAIFQSNQKKGLAGRPGPLFAEQDG